MASGFPGSIDSFTNPLTTSPLNSPSHAGQHQDLNDAVNKIETYMGLVKVIPTSATNGTVAANGTVTIGNAVSSVTVSGAFSSLYDNYRIILNGGTGTTNSIFNLTLGSSTTGYYQGRIFITYGAAAVSGFANNNAVAWSGVGVHSTTQNAAVFDLLQPFLAQPTYLNSAYLSAITGDGGGFGTGFHNVSASYTAFTIAPTSGTITGGTIRVYGYRN